MIWVLSILLLLSIVLNIAAGYYLYKFIKIIMLFEDDISDVISSLDDVDGSMNNVLTLKMFFEDIEIKRVVSEVMETVRMAKFNVNKMSKRFTDHSKQKYIRIIEEPEELTEEEEFYIQQEERLKQKEGTVFHVGRNT
jgi:hypothetical protein